MVDYLPDAHFVQVVLELFAAVQANHVALAVRLARLDSSSTVGDASWPQLVDSTQGDAFQRKILVSRLIRK